MGPLAGAGRIKRRIGRSCRRGYCIRRAWHRHRWIDSSARGTVGNSWVQTQLRSSLALRSRGLRFFPRSDRAANETVHDSALLTNAIAGHDSHDSTSLNVAVPDYAKNLGRDLKGIRIGLPKEYMIEGVDPAVKSAVIAAVKQLGGLGAEIIEVSLPHTDYAISVYYIVATAEASANLARFDGVRYGHRADNVSSLFDHYARTRAEGFGAEVKRRIILGTYVLSSGYYDAYYLRAQKVRELIRRDFVARSRK